MRVYSFAYLLLSLAACGQTKNNSNNNKLDSTPASNNAVSFPKGKIIQVSSPTFDKAHPNAKRLMNEGFYFSSMDDTAPFGNDDGAVTYSGFKDWRQTHKDKNPKEFLFKQIDQWGYPTFDINETDFSKLKPYLDKRELGSRLMSGIDAAIVAIAFGQLYLEGTIDNDFKEVAKTAIKRQLIPELLAFWGDPYKDERKTKLKKMLLTLSK